VSAQPTGKSPGAIGQAAVIEVPLGIDDGGSVAGRGRPVRDPVGDVLCGFRHGFVG